jgi:hypothetical protein
MERRRENTMRARGWTGNFAGRQKRHDVLVAALLVPPLILLLLPFVPYPGDHATEMKVRFRADGAGNAHVFSLPESAGVCSEIRMTMSDRDPATGAFTKVGC